MVSHGRAYHEFRGGLDLTMAIKQAATCQAINTLALQRHADPLCRLCPMRSRTMSVL